MNNKYAALIISEIFEDAVKRIKAGMTTMEVDVMIEALIARHGATPYNKNYKPDFSNVPYLHATCLSVNDTVTHGVPNKYVLKEGDILNVDFGIKVDGVCADSAVMVAIGEISNKNKKLINAAKGTLYAGIAVVKAGIPAYEIGTAMERYAKERGYLTQRMFGGHGIGKEMHELPNIPNYRLWGNHNWEAFFGRKLVAGEVICIEPQIAKHNNLAQKQADNFTHKTLNGENSAYFEHMVLVKEDGHEILTTHFDESQMEVSIK